MKSARGQRTRCAADPSSSMWPVRNRTGRAFAIFFQTWSAGAPRLLCALGRRRCVGSPVNGSLPQYEDADSTHGELSRSATAPNRDLGLDLQRHPASHQDARLLDAATVRGELESLRGYLLVVARARLDPKLTTRAAPSDLVQDVFAVAHRSVDQFRGKSIQELRRWLRTILLRRLSKVERWNRAGRRDVDREVSIEGSREPRQIVDENTPASRAAERRERHQALRHAMNGLPQNYLQVIRWRVLERLTFEEIGSRLGTSSEAARKLWSRALAQLKQALGTNHAT